MRGKQKPAPTRRSVLSVIGTGLAAGLLGTEATAQQGGQFQYVIEQGDRCLPVQPIRGQLPADEFYDFQLPERYVANANGASVGDDSPYASAGTRALQRAWTSIVFLYRGPGGLSLVVVHGSVGASDAGAATFRITGLTRGGEWIVKDDFYRDPDTDEIAPTNYDRWYVDGTDHRIDWTWGSAGTDGGVFSALGVDFDVVIRPAFNEAATLYGQQYDGTVTDWEFLSGPDGRERISLSLDEPIRIRTGGCEGDTSGRTTRQVGRQQVTQEQEQEIVQEQHTREQRQETKRERRTRQHETERDRVREQDQAVEQVQKRETKQVQEREPGQEVEQTQEIEIEQEQRVEQEEDEEEREEAKEERDEEREEAKEEREEEKEEREEAKEEREEEEEEEDGDDD